jgi:hypothetical protein
VIGAHTIFQLQDPHLHARILLKAQGRENGFGDQIDFPTAGRDDHLISLVFKDNFNPVEGVMSHRDVTSKLSEVTGIPARIAKLSLLIKGLSEVIDMQAR